jgi:predicted transcriptional regulator
MKKMTAVEWLIDELNKSIGLTKFVEECDEEYKNEILTIIQQANVMFGEQIKLAFTQGELFSGDFYDPNNPNIDCSENYYNETYNQ